MEPKCHGYVLVSGDLVCLDCKPAPENIRDKILRVGRGGRCQGCGAICQTNGWKRGPDAVVVMAHSIAYHKRQEGS